MDGRQLNVRRAVAFAAAAGLVILYALRGGSFDIVVREEVGLGLWWLVALGWAAGVLPRGRAPRRALAPLVAIAVLAAWTALSLLWTSSSERTFDEVVRVIDYAGLLALVVSLAGRATWRAAAGGAVGGAAVVAGLTVLHRLDPSAFGHDYVAASFGGRRETYPLNYWNGVGAWGAMTVAAALQWSAHARTVVVRALALAAVPVAATSAYLSFSRAAIGGVALAVLLPILLGPRRMMVAIHAAVAAAASALVIETIRGSVQIERGIGTSGAGGVATVLVAAALGCACAAVLTWWLSRRVDLAIPGFTPRRVLAGAAVAAAIVIAALAPTVGKRAWNEFRRPPVAAFQPADPAARLSSLTSLRYTVWQDAVDAAQHKPLLGLGAGTFQYWHDRRGRDPSFLRDAHSLYFESLAELGIPGLLAVLGLIASLLLVAFRARSRLARRSDRGAAGALIATFVVFLWQAGVDWMWELTAVGAFAIGGIALLAAAGGRSELAPRLRPRLPLRAGVAVVALVAALLQLPGLVSTTDERRSADALAAGNPARALTDANHAVSAEPWSTSALVQRAVVEESTGALADARADLLRAVDREPDDWAHELQLSRVEAKLGDAPAALAAYAKARRLRPRAEVFAQPAAGFAVAVSAP